MGPEPERTWDGLEIASDDPRGCTVVVRREVAPGTPQFLLLHRAHHGPDFAGDWAWTAPAGSRQPGEAVYPAALRELGEESGLTGLAVWAVDVGWRAEHGYGWAMLAVDVEPDTTIDLVDPEHDRYLWAPAEQAIELVRPSWVARRQFDALASAPFARLAFRPMRATDFADVADWQQSSPVREWWDGRSLDEESVRARYLPRLRGANPTRMWVVEIDGLPSGFLQSYRVGDNDDYATKTGDPEAVGFDYAIGRPELIGRGLGTRMIWEFCRDVLRAEYPEAPRFLASPSHRNKRSLRALHKCGFTEGLWIDNDMEPGETPDTEIVCTLDVAHWFGPVLSASAPRR
ncbi:MAG: GNAT family N-acetyltransferase [Nocardioidaceae bacterium]